MQPERIAYEWECISKTIFITKRAMSFYQSNQQARLTENSFNREMLKEKIQISNKAK